jgi:hypothetical protein
MGRPVEVRVLSRAVTLAVRPTLRPTSNPQMLLATEGAYLEPFLLAAQRAFMSSESLFRPAAVSAPLFRLEAFCVPPAFLLAAQRAFISWESFLRPAAVSAPFFLAGALAGAAAPVPRVLAQRARAAAASFALVAGEK